MLCELDCQAEPCECHLLVLPNLSSHLSLLSKVIAGNRVNDFCCEFIHSFSHLVHSRSRDQHQLYQFACDLIIFNQFFLFNSHIWEPHESHTIHGIWRFDTFGIAVFILLLLYFCMRIKCTFWPIVCILSKMDRTTIAATRICYFSHRQIDAPYSIRSISL